MSRDDIGDNKRAKLLRLYELFPFHGHPLWVAVKRGELTYDQVIRAEAQHWLRKRAGQPLRRAALDLAQKISPKLFEFLLETYLEECTHDKSGPTHLDLIERLVTMGGWTKPNLEAIVPTPANAAAMALYRDIGGRGAGCHMIGAGAVEFYYSQQSPQIFEAYTKRYGMTETQAETYRGISKNT
ncbi:MAG: hypothetical protein DLM68_08820, partial [Hyphomicrobiales bacterium]